MSHLLEVTNTAQQTLAKLLKHSFELSWEQARVWIRTGKVFVNDTRVVDEKAICPLNAQVRVNMNAPRPAKEHELPTEAVIHFDEDFIVVNKPPGICSTTFGNPDHHTLDVRVQRYAQTKLGRDKAQVGVVHRLDKETSGLMVYATNRRSKDILYDQFYKHDTHRFYNAIVHGHLDDCIITSQLLEDRGDGMKGSVDWAEKNNRRRAANAHSEYSETHVTVLARGHACTLIGCQLKTGRTHQIRIHLSERGHPLLGERVYVRDYKQPWIKSKNMLLHSCELGFTHPKTKEKMHWSLTPQWDSKRFLSARPQEH